MADGLSPKQAGEAYLGVHALVLGFALIRAGHQHAGNPDDPAHQERAATLSSDLLARLVNKLLDGIAP